MCGCSMRRCVGTRYKITHLSGSTSPNATAWTSRHVKHAQARSWVNIQQVKHMPALMHYTSVPVLARGMLGRCAPYLWRMVSRCSEFHLGGLGEERSGFGYVLTVSGARGTLWSCHQHCPEPSGRLFTASPTPSVKQLVFWWPLWRLRFQSSISSMKMFVTFAAFGV